MDYGHFIVGCWLALLAFWAYTGLRVKAAAERQTQSQQLKYQVPLWGAAILLWFHWTGWGLDYRLLPETQTLAACGAAITALGLSGAIWSRVTLGRNWSSAVMLKQGHELVQHGPYRWARNPIYTSLLTMFCGTAIAIGRVRGFAAAALACLAFWIKLKQEEGFMLRQFPQAYPEYKRRVKALVPYLF